MMKVATIPFRTDMAFGVFTPIHPHDSFRGRPGLLARVRYVGFQPKLVSVEACNDLDEMIVARREEILSGATGERLMKALIPNLTYYELILIASDLNDR